VKDWELFIGDYNVTVRIYPVVRWIRTFDTAAGTLFLLCSSLGATCVAVGRLCCRSIRLAVSGPTHQSPAYPSKSQEPYPIRKPQPPTLVHNRGGTFSLVKRRQNLFLLFFSSLLALVSCFFLWVRPDAFTRDSITRRLFDAPTTQLFCCSGI